MSQLLAGSGCEWWFVFRWHVQYELTNSCQIHAWISSVGHLLCNAPHMLLARSSHSTVSGKEIFPLSVKWTRGGGYSHSVFTFWMTAAMFVFAKVHLNPYELNCILLHLIHLKNALTSDRESTVLNPGDEHYSPAKVDVAGCAFPLSIRQLLIQRSNR